MLKGRTGLILFMVFTPSKDLLPPLGLSKTLKDGFGGFSTSSRTVPEDFRRGKPFGSFIGMEVDSCLSDHSDQNRTQISRSEDKFDDQYPHRQPSITSDVEFWCSLVVDCRIVERVAQEAKRS